MANIQWLHITDSYMEVNNNTKVMHCCVSTAKMVMWMCHNVTL